MLYNVHFCLAPEGLRDIGITILSVCLSDVWKMLKFLNGLFPVFCHEYGYTNHLFRKNGGWRLATRSFFKIFL